MTEVENLDLENLHISDNSKSYTEEFWNLCEILIKDCSAPSFLAGTLRPCTDEDFLDFTSNIANNLQNLNSRLDCILQDKNLSGTNLMKFTNNLILIVGENHSKQPWNTEESIKISQDFIPYICKIWSSDNLASAFDDDERFKSILQALRPKLLKDTWKTYPSAIACYEWLLSITNIPTLRRHLPGVIPTALIILDDHIVDNQILGLKCLTHIISHCKNSKCFEEYNYDNVIYNALEKLSRVSDIKLILPLYTCMAPLLDIIDFINDYDVYDWLKRDDALEILLANMQAQQDPEIRLAYMTVLPTLLVNCGTGKWVIELYPVFKDYCQRYTELPSLRKTLETIEGFLNMYHPQTEDFYTEMFTALLKLRIDDLDAPFDDYIKDKIEVCISLLKKLAPKEYKVTFSDERVDSVKTKTDFNALKEVIDAKEKEKIPSSKPMSLTEEELDELIQATSKLRGKELEDYINDFKNRTMPMEENKNESDSEEECESIPDDEELLSKCNFMKMFGNKYDSNNKANTESLKPS